MQRIIVNEGRGPRPQDLRGGRLTIGATPDCDVVLGHPGAQGSQFVIEGTATGHRVVVLLGAVLLNEKPCDVADLQHNDTLRVGDSMVLYKNPDARLPAAARPAGPSVPVQPEAPDEPEAPGEPQALDELKELEQLEALETLEELAELDELDELDELEELAELEELEEPEEPEELETPEAPEEPEARVEPGAAVGQPAHVDPVPAEPCHPVLAATFGKTAIPDVPDDLREALAELQELIEDEHLLEPQADPPDAATGARPGSAPMAVRFARPLPPGHAAPAGPPPAHPGHPQR